MTEALQANLITKEHHETINSFFDKIHKATIDGDEWVETSPEIINHYNKTGLGKAEYFHFQNVKVTEYGKSERLKTELSRQLGSIVHGDSEAHVNQVSKTVPKAGSNGR